MNDLCAVCPACKLVFDVDDSKVKWQEVRYGCGSATWKEGKVSCPGCVTVVEISTETGG